MTLVLRENFVLSISLIAYNKSSTKTLLKSCKSIYQLLIILLCINTTALRHPNDVSGVGFGSAYFVLCTQCFAYGIACCIAIFFIITWGVFFINLINAYQHLLFIRLLLKLYILIERSFAHIIN